MFSIQAGSPNRPQIAGEIYDGTLSEAIEASFEAQTENAILNWNYYYKPLSYKYDFSELILDLLDLLEELQSGVEQTRVHWRSSDFHGDWLLVVSTDSLRISEEKMMYSTRDPLKHPDNVDLNRVQFLAEWKRPLGIIIDALREFSFDRLDDFPRLLKVYNSIPREGLLYTSVSGP